MATDITLHPLGKPIFGNMPPAPPVPALAGQINLAEAADSQVFAVPAPGATMVLVAAAKLRMDIRLQADAAALNPAASSLVLGANERVIFSLAQGNYILRTAVYA